MRKRKKYEESWKPKRVITDLEKKSKNSFSYNNQRGAYKSRLKSIFTHSESLTKKQTEVVIKITGASRNYEGLKAHLRYISRNGEVMVESSDGCRFSGKDDLRILSESFNDNEKIPSEKYIRDNNLKEQREAYHIVFSMKDFQNAPSIKIKKAAMDAVSKMYPNNYFCIAIHNDTDNPHCHLVLKAKDYYGKRIDPRKSDIARMRLSFANELRNLGVDAKATFKKNTIDLETNEYSNDSRLYLKDDYKKQEHRAHYYRVTGYGRANYKFDKDNEESYFVSYMTSKGKEIYIWANDLERVITENNVKTDDYCRFAITDESPVTFTVYDKKSRSWYQKTAYKKVWDVSVENKNEKELKPLKNFTPNDYKKISEPYNEVLDYGVDNYNFDTDKPKSYFVKMRDPNRKEVYIWGKDLENIIKEQGILAGDNCRFKKQGFDERGKTIWSVEIQGRELAIPKTDVKNSISTKIAGQQGGSVKISKQKESTHINNINKEIN
ncbi:relaxase/mobilization nuclease domain-containing protein (plasmid) [Campylobacter fetus]|uniref:Relaxase/mobilization nuclease domain-containing protein n=1 Tax=Campylobacter fetus TaxID=196 RepID=A0A974MU62_CAMFE|nr:MobP1 family relaxase [Campylobacter fetus]QMS59885.1 relaxase/mobilization nuclease domain-containing protein [Campylobacter fetus]